MGPVGTLLAWMPTTEEFIAGLTYVEYGNMSDELRRANNLPLSLVPQVDFFGNASVYVGEHWRIPLSAVVVYLVFITAGPQLMANRCAPGPPVPPAIIRATHKACMTVCSPYARARRQPLPVNGLACYWNFFLSAFSSVGVLATWWTIGHRLWTKGLESTVCGHPVFMGYGFIGVMMLLFIWSKLFELIDTVFLVAKKADVIFLHWYHHVTVLCYCWHSYAVRIPSGIWFAAMNYFVHAIMYAYFGMTQVRRAWARRGAGHRRRDPRRARATLATADRRTPHRAPPRARALARTSSGQSSAKWSGRTLGSSPRSNYRRWAWASR